MFENAIVGKTNNQNQSDDGLWEWHQTRDRVAVV